VVAAGDEGDDASVPPWLVFAHNLSPGEPRQQPCHLYQLPLAVSLSRTPEHAAIMSPTAATMLATAVTIVQNRIVLNRDNLRRVSVYPRTNSLVVDRSFGSNRVGDLVDLSGSGLVPAKPKTLMCAEGLVGNILLRHVTGLRHAR
jgi:hypothetical protein